MQMIQSHLKRIIIRGASQRGRNREETAVRDAEAAVVERVEANTPVKADDQHSKPQVERSIEQ
jgi:hypothetical protein